MVFDKCSFKICCWYEETSASLALNQFGGRHDPYRGNHVVQSIEGYLDINNLFYIKRWALFPFPPTSHELQFFNERFYEVYYENQICLSWPY